MERRQFPRVAANVKVRFTLAEPNPKTPLPQTAETTDASLGGISFNTPHPLLPGTPLTLEFRLEDGQQPPRLVKAQGLVRWCRLGRPPVAMGVRFTHFEGGDQNAYLEWLSDVSDLEGSLHPI